MKSIKQIFYLLFFVTSIGVMGQIRVQNSPNIEEAVKKLAGEGVEISNVTYSFTGGGSPVGTFSDDFGSLGVQNGLLVTNGTASNAEGPNTDACRTTVNQESSVDYPDLDRLVDDPLHDLVVIEFDIVASTDNLEFTYVFGSDEYPEFVDAGFHDVFAFFISGPGINGARNLATVPFSSEPVSVGTINKNKNSNLFVANGTGATPLVNFDVEYDGYTKPLTKSVSIIPCETYHFRIAIADVLDQTCDSGVFLEQNSFKVKNKPTIEFTTEHSHIPYGVEECNDVIVKVTRGELDLENLQRAVSYSYELKGTSKENEDYTVTLPNEITIPVGKESVSYVFTILEDNELEGSEIIELSLTSGCDKIPEVSSASIQVEDFLTDKIPTAITCNDNPTQLNIAPNKAQSYVWSINDDLSCSNCSSPFVTNDSDSSYAVLITDTISGCYNNDTVLVNHLKMKADFEIVQPDCYTTQDKTFKNLSENSQRFYWEFGDGETSTETNPFHTFGVLGDNTKQDYMITLKSTNTIHNCSDTVSKKVVSFQNLFLPNVMTPNDDGKNEVLQIDGIVGDCWTLELYNRYGKLLYKHEHYDNSWSPKNLSDGVYLYYLTNENDDRVFKSTITVIR